MYNLWSEIEIQGLGASMSVWYCPSLNKIHIGALLAYDGIDKLGMYFHASQFDDKFRRFYLIGEL